MSSYEPKESLELLTPARLEKEAITVIKCLSLFWEPIVAATFVSLFWYIILYRHDRNFGDGVQEIITTALLPTLGIIYGILLTGVAVQTVWTEYKAMRVAVKRYDFEAFIDLRDEELSPLVYLIMTVSSLGMLAGFLTIRYPTARSGNVIVFSVTFFLVLMYVIVREIDDPCSGLWVIRGIPPEWLRVDPKSYRKERCEQKRKEFLAKLEKKEKEPDPKS